MLKTSAGSWPWRPTVLRDEACNAACVTTCWTTIPMNKPLRNPLARLFLATYEDTQNSGLHADPNVVAQRCSHKGKGFSRTPSVHQGLSQTQGFSPRVFNMGFLSPVISHSCSKLLQALGLPSHLSGKRSVTQYPDDGVRSLCTHLFIRAGKPFGRS